MNIPATTTAQRIVIGMNGYTNYSNYLGNTFADYTQKVLFIADSEQDFGYPKFYILDNRSWMGRWATYYGRLSTPERITQINIGLGDQLDVNFPAGTTVKIYAKE